MTDSETQNFLLKLFNNSFYHGDYPKVFKKSQITRLHKPTQVWSFFVSPTQLTSCLGKILQIFIYRVKDWCNNNNMIYKQQNEFWSKGRTNNNLSITQLLKQNINKKFVISAVFLDIKKAFGSSLAYPSFS